MTAKERIVDIDLTGVRELHLLTTDAGSSSPERVVPVDRRRAGGCGRRNPPEHAAAEAGSAKDTQVNSGDNRAATIGTPLPSELVYDIAAWGIHAISRDRRP